MSDQHGRQPDPAEKGVTEQELEAFTSLGQQLGAQMAEANFRSMTGRSDWTRIDVDAETQHAIELTEIGSRDIVLIYGADPDGEQWRAIWVAMESQYQSTMMDLLSDIELRTGETLH